MTWTGKLTVTSNNNEASPDAAADYVLRASVTAEDRSGPGDGEPALFTNTEGVVTAIEVAFHSPTHNGIAVGETIHCAGHFSAVLPAPEVPQEVPVASTGEATTDPVATPVEAAGIPDAANDGTTKAEDQTFAPGTDVSYPAADPANAPSTDAPVADAPPAS